MIRTACFLLPTALVLLAALAVSTLVSPGVQAEDDDDGEASPLDYAWYKARLAPILHERCGECHANPRKRKKMGKFFLRPAPGRRIRERYHERNFETVSRYIEPRNPAASLLLLKAIGPQQGGVTHEGGVILRENEPGYGTLVDYINGARMPPERFKPPEPAEGEPDFLFFYKRIEPVLLGVCAECHAGRGKGRHKLINHERGEDFPLEDHYENFKTILQVVVPGRPDRSRFLTKPLAEADGGIRHRGGDRIAKDSANYQNWVSFINGERGPPLPTEGRRPVPTLTAEGIVLQAEEFELGGDLEDVEMKGAEEFYVVVPEAEGGRLSQTIQVLDAGPYVMSVRLEPGLVPITWGFAGGDDRALVVDPTAVPDEFGFTTAGPQNLLDGTAPVEDARGGLELRGTALYMDGRRDEAAWLSPAEVRHTGVSARIELADEEEGGDDALLLFDMADGWNGKFVGLIDGGRRFVIGLLEGGKSRVLQSAVAPLPHRKSDGTRELKVEYYAGVAVGSLDGQPLVFANLSENIGRGRFGLMTHGLVTIHHVAALEEYEVYKVSLRAGSVVQLPRGAVRLWIDLPPGGGAVDSLKLTPSMR